jgi:hypothetical protein
MLRSQRIEQGSDHKDGGTAQQAVPGEGMSGEFGGHGEHGMR